MKNLLVMVAFMTLSLQTMAAEMATFPRPFHMSANPRYPASLDLVPWRGRGFEFETPLPGSKSLTLRDCAIAALARGTSTIRHPGEADDYWRMKDCLRRLGVTVDDTRDDLVVIGGRGGEFATGELQLDVGQSAVTARLMLAFAALRPATTVVDPYTQQSFTAPSHDKARAVGRRLAQRGGGVDVVLALHDEPAPPAFVHLQRVGAHALGDVLRHERFRDPRVHLVRPLLVAPVGCSGEDRGLKMTAGKHELE